jgi:hypothetical protein
MYLKNKYILIVWIELHCFRVGSRGLRMLLQYCSGGLRDTAKLFMFGDPSLAPALKQFSSLLADSHFSCVMQFWWAILNSGISCFLHWTWTIMWNKRWRMFSSELHIFAMSSAVLRTSLIRSSFAVDNTIYYECVIYEGRSDCNESGSLRIPCLLWSIYRDRLCITYHVLFSSTMCRLF